MLHLARWLRPAFAVAIIVAACGLPAPLRADEPTTIRTPEIREMLSQLSQSTDGHVRISYHRSTGMVRFIGSDTDHPITLPDSLGAPRNPIEAALVFLRQFGYLFGLDNPDEQLAVIIQEIADRGRSMVRFQQVHSGVPVLGGELNVNLGSLWQILSASGEIIPHLAMDTTPMITPDTARDRALALVAKQYGLSIEVLTTTEPTLWLYNPALLGAPGPQTTRLVWRMDVSANDSDGVLAVREMVLIDALSGITALHFNQVDTARERLIYDNQNNPAWGLPGNGPVRIEGGVPTGLADADAAYDYLGDTYDFYADYHGRDSLDDAGMPLIATVRYCPNSSECPYQNAFWNGSQMVFGQWFALADDIVAHELTHGVTEHESHLFYYMQSGAINEAFSDIWGEFVDLTNGSGNDGPSVRWLMGEDLAGGAFRNLKNPNQFNHPEKMTDARYACGAWYDNGGVHTNSGVGNKAAYLITDGDTFNGYSVRGLGIEKSARIWYEVQTHLLTSASDYEDLYDALIQAATSLVGVGGITLDDVQQVRYAVAATEMNQQPTACPAKEAPTCEYDIASTLFLDDFENPSSGNWASVAIVAANGWYYPPQSNPYGADATYATSGQYNLWGYDQPSRSDCAIAMTNDVAIPSGAYLHFAHAYDFEYSTYYGVNYYDGGVIEYSVNGGASWQDAGSLIIDNGYGGVIHSGYNNPLSGRAAFVGASNGYISSRLNLGALAGQNVRFRFRLGSDTYNDSRGWFIDDVRIYTCSGAPVGAIHIAPSRPDAPWTLAGPANYSGVGSRTISEAPVGSYTLTWGSVTGCTTPAPSTQTLAAGGDITFSGNYACYGQIAIVTNRADAPWTLAGPANYSGVGSRTISEAPVGSYTLTWGSVTGCTTPAPSTQTLAAGGDITFSGDYACYGQIAIVTNRADAPWTLTGPANYSGVGSQTIASAPVGAYAISWGGLTGCSAPTGETLSLDAGGQIAFDGLYACSAYIINNAGDSGSGTLRWALAQASSGSAITFDPAIFPPTSPVTIALISALPPIIQGNLTLDATGAGVVLDGAALSAGQGLTLSSNDNTLRNLTITRFPGHGVLVTGSGNTIALCTLTGNQGDGVRIEGATAQGNRLTRNTIYANGGAGIALSAGANGALAAPTINDLNPWTGVVQGTACPNCAIEVFADSADEGRLYLGTTTANASGAWSLSAGAQIEGPYLTATAINAANNTSAFSTPYEVTLTTPPLWIANYSATAGGWTDYDTFPRQVGDVNGDGKADIVGFGNKAVYVSLSTGSSFSPATAWIRNFGVSVGGWTSQDIYPRALGDVNGDGKADIVGFGNKAVYVSLSTGSSFSPATTWIRHYGASAGGWTTFDLYPRYVADVNGDGKADIVGFGNKAVYVSLSSGSSFAAPKAWISSYCVSAGGWTSQNDFPRLMGDVNADNRADIIGFGNQGVYVSLSTGASFNTGRVWIGNYGKTAGGWTTFDTFPRQVGDVNGGGRADVIGFGNAATSYSLSTGSSLGASQTWIRQFALNAGGWTNYNIYPRQIADVTGDAKADIVGFGKGGVYVWQSNE